MTVVGDDDTASTASPGDSLFDRLRRGDAAAVARALSAIETGGPQADVVRGRLQSLDGAARVVGFSGPPGVGKSTLVNAYIDELRSQARSVAVLAVDPSSPVTGGAVLGDRTRMGNHTSDPGVFIRSVASRGHLGGLALSIPSMLDVLDAAGFDDIVLEAVGAGQSEVEISHFADTTVILSAPGLGDDVQAIKAGILEVADVLVVNKADLPGADETRRHLEAMLELRDTVTSPPVLPVVALHGNGIGAMTQAIDQNHAAQDASCGPQRRASEALRQAAIAELTRRIAADPELDRLGAAIHRGDINLADAVGALINRAASPDERNQP